MRRATILFFIVLALAHLGATDVSGNQSGTWAQAGNPYNIIGDITVPAELSLTIEPGVEVYVMGNFRLAAAGPLFAVGTESDTIRFMSGQADPNARWKGIKLENTSQESHIAHCYIEKADYGINSLDSPADIHHNRFNLNQKGMQVFGIGSANPAVVHVHHNLVEYSIQNGILVAQNSNGLIEENEIRFNGTGSQYMAAIQLSNQSAGGSNSPVIQNNHIHHNFKQGVTGWDIVGANAIQPQIRNNLIEYNLTGIYLLHASGYVADNIIRYNFISGNANSGAGVMVSGATSEPYFERNEIYGNFTGFYLGENAQPCLGNLNIYHAYAQGGNQIYDNIDESNTLHSVFTYSYNTPGTVIYAENNYWGSNDPAQIAIGITDQIDNPALPLVDFDPFIMGQMPTSISGSVAYDGSFELNNHTIQFVGVDSGEILYESPVDPSQPFSFSLMLDEPFHAVLLADVVGIDRTLYGSPGGLILPESFTPGDSAPIELGDIEIQAVFPPRYQDVGAPEQIGAYNCYPVYNRFFVYHWDYINWLYEEGDFLYVKRHERYKDTGNLVFNLADGIVWDKIANLEHNDVWLRTEVMNDVGAQRVSMLRCKVVNDDASAKQTYQLITQTDTVNQQIVSARILQANNQRLYHYFGSYVKRAEYIVSNIPTPYLQESTWWKFMPFQPVFQPSFLCYDYVEHGIQSPWALTLYWQAPMNDAEHTWTHYRIYNHDTLYAELPFNLNFWHTNTFQYTQAHLLTVCAFDGQNESPRSNEVWVAQVSASDPVATPPVLSVGPNPVSFQAGGVDISIKSSAPLSGQIGIYNLRGQLVRLVPVNSEGDFSLRWDLRDTRGSLCSAGIYLFKAELSGHPILQQRLVLIK